MLLASQLHSSLEASVFDSGNFLTEIIDKFPNAISFAPGAPNPARLCDIDISRYIDQYIQYLCSDRGFDLQQARLMLYQYGPARGIINDLVANAIQRDKGIHVPPEALVITVGAQEAILIVLRALFRFPSDTLAIVNPCFVGVLGAARLLDINVVGIDETDHGIDLDALHKTCTAARGNNRPIRLLYVAPDYSNPLGTRLTLDMRVRLLALAEQHDFLLLEDNTYGFTAPLGQELPSLKALDKTERVIFIGTFAKICMPGARVGYVIADQLVHAANNTAHRLASDLAKIKSMTTLNTSPICQAIIAGMLLDNDGSLAALEQESSTLYQRNLALLLNTLEQQLPADNTKLKGISWNRPQGGFFIQMRLPIPVDITLLKHSASNYGVLWTPMSFFYLNNNGNNALRLSCSYLTPTQIEEGVDRLSAFLHDIAL